MTVLSPDSSPPYPNQPSAEQLIQQAEWLAPARSRLLRRNAIARRKRILDLGAGFGAVTGELARRGGGATFALDADHKSLCEGQFPSSAWRIVGLSVNLPLASAQVDLVFCQCALLWMSPLVTTISEIWRVLRPAGALVAIEPDFGGLIEHPSSASARELWLKGLRRAGAEPQIGRVLPGMLEAQGFGVRVDLLDQVQHPSPIRFDLLRGLPLTESERARLSQIESGTSEASGWAQIVHLPFFLVSARKSVDGN